MAIIYKATNTKSDKSYIGFTDRSFERRIQEHINAANKKSRCKLHRAIKKHGTDVFNWSIIYDDPRAKFTLEQMEPYYIKKFNTFSRKGYNMTPGGDRGPSLPGKLNPMYGNTHTEKIRKKISERKNTNKNKSYEQLYGTEKADKLKKVRSISRSSWLVNHPPVGSNNGNYDFTIYEFVYKDDTIFKGTIFELRQYDSSLTKVNTHWIKKGKTTKGWKLHSSSSTGSTTSSLKLSNLAKASAIPSRSSRPAQADSS